LAAGQLDSLFFAQDALDYQLQYEGPDAWWTNMDRLDLARVLHQLDCDAEFLNLLEQLEPSLTRLEDLDQQDQQLMAEAWELRDRIEARTCGPSHVRAASFASLRRSNRFANQNLMIDLRVPPSCNASNSCCSTIQTGKSAMMRLCSNRGRRFRSGREH
jgi:hypothetical protein